MVEPSAAARADPRPVIEPVAPDDRAALEASARCLAEAFSSGLWRSAPMPLGTADDPHSARGVVAGLGPGIVALAAREGDGGPVLGCVVGAALDAGMIEGYGLATHGAQAGDGLLAYIGIVPRAQGLRLACGAGPRASLARRLVEDWLALPAIAACPAVYVRTRRRIGPVLHLGRTLGFERVGEFGLEFRGEPQHRIVLRRPGRGAEGPAR
ncbi:hypothetical protein P2H44_04200 [Albimonas sp. CAU 1670]|uniref:hypothetical protein n=1 Tax=Albimonas sp. CAU 1670 TaxID=3032599 RepID=UPI0023DC5438|nr:hypothetical protein [Albimonas sp. CAU 1670]MDF2231745.1 hypothetical protein [Albimonas sp. CAU 1670]